MVRDDERADVERIAGRFLLSGGIVTVARLELEMKRGPTVGIDIIGLDQDHDAIVKAAKKKLKGAGRARASGRESER